jgi:hypothetical protein
VPKEPTLETGLTLAIGLADLGADAMRAAVVVVLAVVVVAGLRRIDRRDHGATTRDRP